MKKESLREESKSLGVVEVIAALWAIGVMGYFYYDKGYIDLMGQIWRLFFG